MRCVFLTVLLIFASAFLTSCGKSHDGKTHITYWEKWTGFEADAMRKIVEDFNASQSSIVVHYTSISGIGNKLLTATAGGNPPDVAGTWSALIPKYAEQWALTPLDPYLEEAGITKKDYIPVFWKLCQYRGHTWALPTTPGTTALIWNKTLFKNAGLDPNRPPQTLKELDEYAKKLTRYDSEGNLVQLGFLPTEPGWYNYAWIYWFGGNVWDSTNKITYDSSAGYAMAEWIASYTRELGRNALHQFSSGFGNFASPQNAFLAGKIAMELQGVWMHNFISKYAPGLDWGAAPFPAVDGVDPPVVYTECDVLVIPRGSQHPDEAFAFIRYVNERTAMEKLCIGQRKASPLASVSSNFFARHPHPYIRVFHDTTWSPRAFSAPQISIHEQITREVNAIVDEIRLLETPPSNAILRLQNRCQTALDRMLRRRNRRKMPSVHNTGDTP